jgi:hypothetical protein
VAAAANSDGYTYFVVKFWTVQEVCPDGRLMLRTRTGKTHLFNATDPNLKRLNWWNRWFYRRRFLAGFFAKKPR